MQVSASFASLIRFSCTGHCHHSMLISVVAVLSEKHCGILIINSSREGK